MDMQIRHTVGQPSGKTSAPMQYRQLGASNLAVSRIGCGTWALGGRGWGAHNEREARAALEACLAHGINFFDTAPVYGFGRAEQVLGEALSGVRKNVVIATKCGLVWNAGGQVRHDLTRDGLRRDLEASLRRLQTDCIDLYQIHWPDRRTPLEESLDELAAFQRAGAVRHIGVCNFSAQLLQRACGLAPVVSVQQLYNLLQQDEAREVLPLCREHGLGFIAYSPLAQGVLGGDMAAGSRPGLRDVRRRNPLYRDPERFARAVRYAAGLRRPAARAALRFLLDQPGVTCVLVGMTKRTHVETNVAALDCTGAREPG
jgi:aryl-alcohol dehydrogenase-like predicted oxidoreductase